MVGTKLKLVCDSPMEEKKKREKGTFIRFSNSQEA